MGAVSLLLEKRALQRQQEWRRGRTKYYFAWRSGKNMVWVGGGKIIRLTRGNRNNFSQKENIPVPEAMNWHLWKRGGDQVSQQQAWPIQLSACKVLYSYWSSVCTVGWQLLSPHSLWKKEEAQAPELPLQFPCLSYSLLSARTNPYLMSICCPFSQIFNRNFCIAFIFWRNGNDLKYWVTERREISGN